MIILYNNDVDDEYNNNSNSSNRNNINNYKNNTSNALSCIYKSNINNYNNNKSKMASKWLIRACREISFFIFVYKLLCAIFCSFTPFNFRISTQEAFKLSDYI